MGDDTGQTTSDTAARIREVALDLFTAQGYEKTSLRQIAEQLGISKAAVYYHYRSKLDLLDELMSPLVEAEERIIHEAEAAPPDTLEARFKLIERFIDLLLEHRRLATYVMSDIVGVSNSRSAPRLQRYDRRLVALLAGPDLSLPEQVRALSAFGAAMSILVLLDVPRDELRPLVLEAAQDALRLRRTS